MRGEPARLPALNVEAVVDAAATEAAECIDDLALEGTELREYLRGLLREYLRPEVGA